MKKDKIELTIEEYENLIKQLKSFADFQRLSSFFVWMGLLMVVLHILADIYFHARGS